MKMLNVGIGPETGNTRELNSGDIDLQSQAVKCILVQNIYSGLKKNRKFMGKI